MNVPLLKLSILPSFEDGCVLTLMKTKREEKQSYLLRLEEAKLSSGNHLVAIGQDFSLSEDIKVSEEEAEGILGILKSASIAVVPAYKLALDGIMYELVVKNGMNEGHYRWHGTVPKGWESLSRICDKLLSLAGRPAISS